MSTLAPTTLLRISVDVLVLIAERLDGIETLNLAKTCPKLLRSLCQEARLTLFQVCARKANRQFRIPSLISHMPYLTHLALCLGGNSTVGPLSHYLAQPLPRTLQLLRLQFREAEKLFSMSPLETSMVFYLRHPTHGKGEAILDLKSAFPELHTLELHGQPAIQNHHVSNLPPTLTRLSFSGLSLDNQCMGELPRNLLYVRIYNCRDFTSEGFPSLPPHLEYLELPSMGVTMEGYQLLPPSVTQFIGKKCLDLPPLSSGNTQRSRALELYPFPRALKSLEISLKNFESPESKLEALSRLPSRLTKLHLTDAIFSSASLSSLPKTLKSLKMSAQPDWKSAEQWPEGLTKLTVLMPGGGVDEGSPLVVALPEQLRSLKLGVHVDAGPWLTKLPKGLKKLCVSNATALTLEHLQSLPRGIETMWLFQTLTFFSDSWISALPGGLTRLYLGGNAKITKAGLMKIPRSITDLTLDLTENAWVNDNMVKQLPPNLEWLGAPSAVINSPNRLPPNLIGIRLQESPPFPLPPTVVYLWTGGYQRPFDEQLFLNSSIPRVLHPTPDSLHAQKMLSPNKRHDVNFNFW
jgi:hypothetical protein